MKLRAICEKDLDAILEWRNAPNVSRNMYTTHTISRTEHQEWFDSLIDDSSRRYFVYGDAGVDLGVVGFSEIDHRHRRASWAFYASPTAPKGTGSRMEFSALEQAFGELRLHKLRCEVLAFNEQVLRLHKKFGFSIEGVMRDHHFDGERYIDVVQLGLLGSEWGQVKDAFRVRLGIKGEENE
ncbi:UDP-4-amino-4,6-dideoxy-N-acetyl-beta-L-altrosamine N-acetyltransferase [Cupriavidus sp. AcVe19-6a]|uniref:UDP-4-amino-4, 6-dideoxy-N-acetyl-beta-L-altrosamine N-acetyltransferase n=1 Tax=Cupriavidus sp. AcVe19-6a TaxID=2821358 RepID=UPI001AEB1729|nr:UDP-4-amino-4,6-dideoxy-N-acetyl-beta-L-altrosamine N-acetyltransferase [Cupriavidus sp. AcVe19-6a]MBP0640061.1 UDP-4-amino-4,6-dideoxy-N-acetyl-beta-L-altrosamine N-acetyltransferase [Cupriavidus sp. AcVe19-6a]